MTRLNTSRPASSVPSRYLSDGPCRRTTGSMNVGSWGARTGASRATSTNPRMITALTNATGFSSRVRSQYQREDGEMPASGDRPRRTERAESVDAESVAAIANPRVEEDVEDVDQEIDQHVDASDRHHRPLDQRIVAPADTLDDEPPHAGDREDGLRHHRAAEQPAQRVANHGDGGDQRVPQRMANDDHAPWQPLGEGGPHVILAQHVEHRGANEPREQTGRREAEGKGGENHPFEMGNRILGDRDEAARRQPMQPDREE